MSNEERIIQYTKVALGIVAITLMAIYLLR